MSKDRGGGGDKGDGGLQQHQEWAFQIEHQKIMRALLDSLERESELQRQLRRMKESLVAVALRFQVAAKVAKDDETTIAALRKETEEARAESLINKKQAEAAAEIIDTLRLEVSSLRRKMKDVTADGKPLLNSSNYSTSTSTNYNLGLSADQEVDEMMKKGLSIPIPKKTGGNVDEATSFQRWKIQKFLWTPDTPSASENHEMHTVDLLAQAATAASMKTLAAIEKPTMAGIAKMKSLRMEGERSGHLGSSTSGSSTNLFSRTDSADLKLSSSSSRSRLPNLQKKDLISKDFLDAGMVHDLNPDALSPTKWGSKVIDKHNRAKDNLWLSTQDKDYFPSDGGNPNMSMSGGKSGHGRKGVV